MDGWKGGGADSRIPELSEMGDYLLFILTVMDSKQKMQILSPVMLLSNNDANAHRCANSIIA